MTAACVVCCCVHQRQPCTAITPSDSAMTTPATVLPHCLHHALRSSSVSCSSRSYTAIARPLSSDRKRLPQLGERHCLLLAGLAQRLHADGLGGGFVRADQQRKARARRVGFLHL